jgi:CheY-like chemotaxis protein
MPGIVLVVDDDAEVRATLGDYLREEGFDVLEAANGLEALLQVKRVRPRAVVLDLMMPRLGGLDALKWIHAFDPAIGVVVVTGTEDSGLHREALALGALAVFTKPVRVADLAAALGAGATPAAPPPAPAPAPVPAAAAPPAAKVLIVDDEPEVRATLEELLRARGYETRGAGDGLSGVRAVLDWRPDVVLLDIGMPGLSGVGALPVIAALAPSTKVIMVSGSTNVEVSKRALAYGAFDYVTKPVDVGYLARAIDTAVTMKQLESGG